MLEILLVLAVGVLVFGAAVLGDFVEAYYTRAIADLDEVRGPRMSVAMFLVSLVGLLAFVKAEGWYQIAVLAVECVGVWLGTKLAIRRQRRAREQREASFAAPGTGNLPVARALRVVA